jgi:hypothetical protein
MDDQLTYDASCYREIPMIARQVLTRGGGWSSVIPVSTPPRNLL